MVSDGSLQSTTILRNSTYDATAGLKASKLRCEYRVNPLGIDVLKPRLSWVVESSERGRFQTAYQIIVSSTRLNLKNDIGDLWNSGKVESSETNQIEYDGVKLLSRMECWWKVRVWDKYGRPSKWSESAYWTMGLLKPEDWEAKWIGYDEYAEWEEPNFKGCRWIWFKEARALFPPHNKTSSRQENKEGNLFANRRRSVRAFCKWNRSREE